MPFVEDREIKVADPGAWVGINVTVATPSMFCALGPVDVEGLWHARAGVNARWKVNKPPVPRAWKPFNPGHTGGF